MSQRCKTAHELGKMAFKAKISGEKSGYVCFAKEEKSLSAKHIIQRSHISCASLHNILKEAKICKKNQECQRKKLSDAPENWVHGKSNYFCEKSEIEEIRGEIYCEATYAANRHQSKTCFLP